MVRILVACLLLAVPSLAWAWGQEGHSIIAEIAQRRLTPDSTAEVQRLLGSNHSLASVASWADDERDVRPETYNWHFVDMRLAADKYVPSIDCHPHDMAQKGDCIIAELERLKNELRCADNDDKKRDALKFAVHFVGDIHQPLHTVLDMIGGNTLQVTANMSGALLCQGQPCKPIFVRINLHAVWDTTLIQRTAWNWGSYVDRLETGWVGANASAGRDGGSLTDWAEGAHAEAKKVWGLVPANRVLDDNYYQAVLPILDQQLGLAGLRLARFLNEAYASTACPRH